jgi:hypothetical protein
MAESDAHVIITLYDIQKALGRIEQKVDSSTDMMKTHIAEDKTSFATVDAGLDILRLASAKQKGFLSAVGAVASVIGAAMGYLIDRYTRGT